MSGAFGLLEDLQPDPGVIRGRAGVDGRLFERLSGIAGWGGWAG